MGFEEMPAGSPREESEDVAARRRRDAKAAYRARWNDANPDRVAAWKARYQANHHAEINERERSRRRRMRDERKRQGERDELERQREEDRRSYARRYADAHKESNRERQRAYRARRQAEDPEAYRLRRNELQRAWYERHKGRITARARDAYRTDPRPAAEKSRRHYERHAEKINQRRREAYRLDREKTLSYNREWKARERRRQAAGLPPRRIHRVRPAERDSNLAQADEFFAGTRTEDERKRIRAEWVTPTEVRKREARDAARARAIDYERNAAMVARKAEARRRATAARREEVFRTLSQVGTTPEEARMDEIARVMNARLRARPEQRRTHHNDPAAPHTGAAGQSQGLSR
ncbi:hypothetical protein ACLQ2Q_22090 [Microbacterium sp. DT81.1]|uniref:hypothetical protein n=1 Tax=Microbacterium sp. DT81.1 TaxID=3393413 RepID=UPI003CEDB2E0